MAKDNRKKSAANAKVRSSKSKKRKKLSARSILFIACTVFLILVAVFLFVFGKAVLEGDGNQDPTTSNIPQHYQTPENIQNKVAYYVIGLLGEDETSTTEMLAVACYDKQKSTLNFLEIPQDTKLADSNYWSVDKAGNVWGNPAPLIWCEFENRHIYEVDVEAHRTAGHTVTERIGSASENLMSVINETCALPVDAYFMIPQEAFVKLVNLVGGVDVDLETSMKVGEIKYNKGIQTLDGDAALQYVLTRGKGAKGDIERILRQRKVFAALFERLCAQTKEELSSESLAPLMKGSTPIRTNMSTADLVELVLQLSAISSEKITVQMIPGEVSADSYFSIHRAQLVEQLNAYFNPYLAKITEADVLVLELAQGTDANVHLQTFAQITVEQGNDPAGTTTTTKKDG